MNRSIFNRLYTYRQKENKNERENFLIEMLAFYLENDEEFLTSFLKGIGIFAPIDRHTISSQSSYDGLGRPDIEILINNDHHILIECKVESLEGIKQLERYDNILSSSNKTHKHLIYLTKYSADVQTVFQNDFKHLRWVDVLRLIPENAEAFLKEFKTYLIEEDMDIKNFTLNDVIALQHIHQALKKLDDALDTIEPDFKTVFGGANQRASRSTRLVNDDWYGIYRTLAIKDTGVQLGIGKYEDEVIPAAFVEFYFPKGDVEASNTFKKLKESLNYSYYDDDWYGYIHHMTPITTFMKEEGNSIKLLSGHFKEKLKSIFNLKDEYPEIFG